MLNHSVSDAIHHKHTYMKMEASSLKRRQNLRVNEPQLTSNIFYLSTVRTFLNPNSISLHHIKMHQNDTFSQTETKSQNKKTVSREAQKHTGKKYLLSQTETKSLNQKTTATHYPFILFKIPFLKLRPNLRLRKSLHRYHLFIIKIHPSEAEFCSCEAQQHTCQK